MLTPIWPPYPETASRVRGRIETIIDFAKPDDELRPNPARWRGDLAKKLPNPKLAGKHVTRDGVAVRSSAIILPRWPTRTRPISRGACAPRTAYWRARWNSRF